MATLLAMALAALAAHPLPLALPLGLASDAGPTAILIGAGDINDCGKPQGAESTAEILEAYPTATIFAAGDLAYFSGSDEDFRCYDNTWGRPALRDRTRPAVGNHEYVTWDAGGYFRYWRKAREVKPWEITAANPREPTTVIAWARGTWW